MLDMKISTLKKLKNGKGNVIVVVKITKKPKDNVMRRGIWNLVYSPSSHIPFSKLQNSSCFICVLNTRRGGDSWKAILGPLLNWRVKTD